MKCGAGPIGIWANCWPELCERAKRTPVLASRLNPAPPPSTGGPLAPLPVDQRTEKVPPAVTARARTTLAQGRQTTFWATAVPPNAI